MDIKKHYVVYELRNVMGNDEYKALSEIRFINWKTNSLETEEDAIKAMIEDDMKYNDYVILKQIYID